MKILLLIYLLLTLTSSCTSSPSQKQQSQQQIYKKTANTQQVQVMQITPKQVKIIATNNWANTDENKALSQLENYIRNSSNLINNAKLLRIPDARYQFNYHYLENDLAEITNSIKRFVEHNKTSQVPRKLQPLRKRY